MVIPTMRVQKKANKEQNRREKQLFVERPWWKSKTKKGEKQKC